MFKQKHLAALTELSSPLEIAAVASGDQANMQYTVDIASEIYVLSSHIKLLGTLPNSGDTWLKIFYTGGTSEKYG